MRDAPLTSLSLPRLCASKRAAALAPASLLAVLLLADAHIAAARAAFTVQGP